MKRRYLRKSIDPCPAAESAQADMDRNFSFFFTLSKTSHFFYVSAVYFFQHCGKRRNCSYRAVSPFPTVLSTLFENAPPFPSNSKLSSANSFSLEESKICRLGKG